jgi:hypothetical protein
MFYGCNSFNITINVIIISYGYNFFHLYTVIISIPLNIIVTKPPKIISYYRLSLSTRSLSNNKELLCCLCRVKLGKSLTTGSRYALSPHEGGTRVQHYIT